MSLRPATDEHRLRRLQHRESQHHSLVWMRFDEATNRAHHGGGGRDGSETSVAGTEERERKDEVRFDLCNKCEGFPKRALRARRRASRFV